MIKTYNSLRDTGRRGKTKDDHHHHCLLVPNLLLLLFLVRCSCLYNNNDLQQELGGVLVCDTNAGKLRAGTSQS